MSFLKHLKKILNILKVLNPAGVDNLSGKLLKYGADILARPISQLGNFSIRLNSFPRSCIIVLILQYELL